MRKRKRRSAFVAKLLVGAVALSVSYRDVQARVGEQHRQVVVEQSFFDAPTKKRKQLEFILSTTVFLTSGTTWTVPNDCVKCDSVACIGGGVGGSNGATGGTGIGGAS